MKIMKLYILAAALTTVTGCATTDYLAMSKGSGLQTSELTINCKGITCSYDKLKDRVQASASDMNLIYALNGNESRTIQFTWVSGSSSKDISVDLFRVGLFDSWLNIDSAEIYIGKEVVARVEGSVERIVGVYNSAAKEHEKIEIIRGVLGIEQAEKIASANYKDVTIRFYTKGGYKDVTLPRTHKLINVVNLAKSA